MQASWTLVKLGDVAIVKSGFAFKSGDMGEIGAPIIKIKNIAPPNVDIEDVQRVPFELISNNPRVEKFALQVGDILIAMTGATVGKVGRMPSSKETFYLNQRVGKVFIKGKKANYDYLYYVLSQESCASQIFSLADGSAQANISGSQIENINFLLPPVNEQTAIARFLVSLDKKIELNTKLNQTLESMAQALFKSWFVDFDPVIDNAIAVGNPIPEPFQARAERRRLRLHEPVPEGQSPLQPLPAELRQLFPNSFQETEELGWVPEGWVGGDLGEIFVQRRDKVNKEIAIVLSAVAKGELVKSEDHFTKQVFSKSISKYLMVRKWDIAYNPSRINIGSIGLHKDDYIGAVSPVYVVASVDYDYRRFVENFFSTATFRGWVRTLSSGSVRQSLSFADFASIPCVIPSRKVTHRYNAFCDEIYSQVKRKNEESMVLEQLRDSLLPKLLSGQLRIPDAEAQLAEAGV